MLASTLKYIPPFKRLFSRENVNRKNFPFNNFHHLVRDGLTPQRHMAWKEIMDNDKFFYVPLDTFKEVAIDSGQFRYQYTSVKKYTLHTPRPKLDHYVAEAMKEWNFEEYKKMYGYTRKAHPDRMYYTILMYCAPIHKIPQMYREGFEHAKEVIRKRLAPSRKLNFLDLSDMARNVPMNTSVGYEFMDQRTKDRKVKSDFLREAKFIASKRYHQIYKGEKCKSVPYTLAMRGHLTDINSLKSRPIWLAPYSTVLLENIMYRPMYDHIFKNCNDFIFTGKDTLARLNSFLNEFRCHSGDVSFINTDVSQWDRMRCRELTLTAFDIIESFYDLDEGEKRLFDYLKWDFIKTNVCLPDGTVLQRSAGHSTGSLGILLLNSVVNAIAMETVLYYTVNMNRVTLQKVLGDDYAFYFLGNLSEARKLVSDMAIIMKDCFDLLSKPEKMIVCGITDERKFIGYQLKNGKLYKPEDEIFRSMLHPETIVKSLKISFSRMLSYYLLVGCNNRNFVNFFQQYLGYYEEELRSYDSIYDSIVQKHGSLRIFKYVFHIDDSELVGMKFDDIQNLDNINAPYLLINNSKLLGILDAD